MPRTFLARIIAFLSLALSLVLAGFVGWTLLRAPDDQARAGAEAGGVTIGGPFTLTDQHGERRTEKDFAGQFKLIYFGFTYCPDICPTELQTMSAALKSLEESQGSAAGQVTPIFITIDPERDTVEQMRAYAEHFHPRLVALTGTEAEIASVAKAYRVYYARVEDESTDYYMMDHSSIIYLMGPDGQFLTHFGAGTSADQMAESIEQYL
jgi:cytochrome oxidase Cu insertion factor (SCO1/SenC/PrrC family)